MGKMFVVGMPFISCYHLIVKHMCTCCGNSKAASTVIDHTEPKHLAITEPQNEHRIITDDRAKNIVALYGALLSMNERTGAESANSARNAGYVVYTCLGGQAKREITYRTEE